MGRTACSARSGACRRYASASTTIHLTAYFPALARPIPLLLLATWLSVVGTPYTVWGARANLGASTSRAARQNAVAAMPLAHLSSKDRQLVQNVVKTAGVFRRLPTQVFDCDPKFYVFLLENPHAVVDTWRVLGISKVKLTPRGNSVFDAQDGHGTKGRIRTLFCEHDETAHGTLLVYARGEFNLRALGGPVVADAVMLLRSGSVRETDGRDYVTARVDTFIRTDRVAVDFLAKTLHPLWGRAADKNLIDTTHYVGALSRTAERNPSGFRRLVSRLSGVSPQTRQAMLAVAAAMPSRPPAKVANAANPPTKKQPTSQARAPRKKRRPVAPTTRRR